MAAKSRKALKVWDIPTRKLLYAKKDDSTSINCVSFSPDGRRLASGRANRTIILRNVETGEALFTWGEQQADQHPVGILSVCFSPDGKRLASTSGAKVEQNKVICEVKIWDVSTQQKLLLLDIPENSDHVASAVFSPDGTRLAVASWDGSVKIWNVMPRGADKKLADR